MKFERLNYIQRELGNIYKQHTKKIYTLAILTTINLLLSISIFFHVIPTDTVPLRRLIKNDLQTETNNGRFTWLNKAYIDTNDVFVTLPSGSCSQVNSETFDDAISPFISFFTTDNANEYGLGQKYIQKTDYNEVDIGKKAIDQKMFIETTTTSAPSTTTTSAPLIETTTTSAPLIEIFDLTQIKPGIFKSCKFYTDDNIGKVATVGNCKEVNTCKNNTSPECYRNEYCYIASKGAADICRPGLYYDFCIIAGYKTPGFSFTYENASDDDFYLVAFIGAISCIFNSAVFMFLFYYKAFRSKKDSEKDNKCQKKITNCCLTLWCCQKVIELSKEKELEETKEQLELAEKKAEIKTKEAKADAFEIIAEDSKKNTDDTDDFPLQDERHIRFDFSGPNERANTPNETAEGAKNKNKGATKKTQCCDKLPTKTTCWNFIKWGILILVFVTDVVILYCFFYSYFALVGIQSSDRDKFFQPNNYEQKDEHAVFDNIHPNISPALTEMFTVAMFFIVWWLHLVLSVVRLFVGGLLFKQSRGTAAAGARYGRYEMVRMSDDNCNELRF